MSLSPVLLLTIIALHFLILLLISFQTSKGAKNETFFVADRNANWILVSYSMIGVVISGVTFMSVPGNVGGKGVNMAFYYLQFILGNVAGFYLISRVLLPIYYKMRVTSIYEYLRERLGVGSHQTGALFFLISRQLGAAFRLYLMCLVLQEFVMAPFGIPFWATAFLLPTLIWIYTYNGGTKTIIVTDTLQTTFFLSALIITFFSIASAMQTNVFGLMGQIFQSAYAKTFYWEDWNNPSHFIKQFMGGLVTTIAMSGLDQDIMQKNLTCRNIKDAQKNMYTFTVVIFFVNVLFVMLGAALYLYAQSAGFTVPERTDKVFAFVAFNHLPIIVGILFLVGVMSATYASSDSALAALTTSFCVDFLHFTRQPSASPEAEKQRERTRILVHIGFSVLTALIVIVFNELNDDAVVNKIFQIAGYTYGPLLGLFMFGLFTRQRIKDRYTLVVAAVAVALAYTLDQNSAQWFNGFKFGFLTLSMNGLLMFTGLWLIRDRAAGLMPRDWHRAPSEPV